MDFTAAVLLACLGAAGLFLVPFWVSRRTTDPTIMSRVDPILGVKDQAAIHDIDTSFIPMPDHLRTNDEVVAWLTQDLPKLTTELSRPRR
ncbi:hypothetical protein AA309_07370 [Microvirga vignae]|uniref:Uncharacterized protein n=1 Tax=Microvirga vignae TaxID=1225564 RepID=A0A0H1RLY5_9HYPH|nr:hypothetical protein [Microvirga vignae]KLK93667.1 hypothetical protein AA309_07370 [Microvirga vignae]